MKTAAGLAGRRWPRPGRGQEDGRHSDGGCAIHDRGSGKVLDDIHRLAHVNTIFLGVFTYTEHARRGAEAGLSRGNFAAVHPQYYKDTPLTPADMQATDFGDYDVLRR